MEDRGRSLRVGVLAVLFAVLLRLYMAGGLSFLERRALKPNTDPGIQQETGQTVRFSPSIAAILPYPAESPAPWGPPPAPPEPDRPSYAGAQVQVLNYSAREPDIPALLAAPLGWDLADGEPAVLILSTHTTESYTRQEEPYEESAAWRTLDAGYNMLSIGARVAELLEAAGIRVVVDGELHDYPSYNGSYADARQRTQALLQEYPTVRLVLDLHRDASDAAFGQLRTVAQNGDQICAQLMPVLGGGHEGWEHNLSLGLKLMAQLETQVPGITRPLLMRNSHFNQDLCPGALLIEVGAAGNTHPEALLAADQLASAIIALSKGTQ